MKLEDKAQFNQFASHFCETLRNKYNLSIKPSKAREALALSAGYKSHNALLSNLPIPYSSWIDMPAFQRLNELLRDKHGFNISTLSVVAEAMLLFEASQPAGRDDLEYDPQLSSEGLKSRLDRLGEMLEIDAGLPCVHDYAWPIFEQGVLQGFYLTKVGEEVMLLATALHKQAYEITSAQEFESVESEFIKLHELHPKNPWVLAAWIDWQVKFYKLDGWSANPGVVKNGYFELDFDDSYRDSLRENALFLLDDARSATDLFDALLASDMTAFDSQKVIAEVDCRYLERLFYQCGCIGLNAGYPGLAKRWLNRAASIGDKGVSEVKSRYYLSMLCLNSGRGDVARYFHSEERDPWGQLIFAAKAFAIDDMEQALEHMANALIASWSVLEAFTGKLKERDDLVTPINHHIPAFMAEFMWHTKPFWEKHSLAYTYFYALCSSKDIRRSVLAYHRRVTSIFEDKAMDLGKQLELKTKEGDIRRTIRSVVSNSEKI